MREKKLDIELMIRYFSLMASRYSLIHPSGISSSRIYFCRYSGDKDIFGNVFIHNASGGDDRVLADCHTGKDRTPRPDPYIVRNDDRLARARIVVNVQLMIGTVQDTGTRAILTLAPILTRWRAAIPTPALINVLSPISNTAPFSTVSWVAQGFPTNRTRFPIRIVPDLFTYSFPLIQGSSRRL